MPLYRCENCGGEAEHPTPKCEPCGLDPKTEPRAAQLFTELVVIHFEPPHGKVVGWGKGYAACDEKIKFGGGIHRFTSERPAVSCPRCKTTPVFLDPPDLPPQIRDSVNRLPVKAAAAAPAPKV